MTHAILPSPIGFLKIYGDENGLVQLIKTTENEPTNPIPDILQEAVNQLNAYFEGKRNTFELKLNPKGTPFQKEVWKNLEKIPFGSTISYLELAKKMGQPKPIRAIAAANGKNPLWIIIPCHRVVGSNGDLVGYAGGLPLKKWLLDHENPNKQQILF